MRLWLKALLSCVFVTCACVPVCAADLPYGNLKWRSIGPAVSGGRATSVAGSDADPLLYYAGAAGGGIWRSNDAGASWSAVDEALPVNAIGAVAIAPSNKNIVWVGTGEANPRNDFSWGDGVWRSTDGGKSWKHSGLDDSFAISRILVDPRNPNVALVGALGDVFKDGEDRGVYRTVDGGKTWTKTLYVGPSSGASDLAWDPVHPNVVFAGIWQVRRVPWSLESGGPNGGLYRSSDGGQTWAKLSGSGFPTGDTGRIGVAVARAHPDRVYAIIQSKQGVLWRSDDGGNSWRLMSSDTLLNQRPFYFSRVVVDPSNQDHVIAISEYLAESRDGGRTFKKIAKAIHADFHDVWWSRDGQRLISANDGGVGWSADAGKIWSAAANLPIGQIYKLGYDLRTPYQVCAGFQDNTSFCGPSDSNDAAGILNRDWISLNGGDGNFVWPDPLDPQLIWNAIENGVVGIFDERSQQGVDVEPYPRDTEGAAIEGIPYRFNWTTPIAFSPQDPHVAYVGGNVVFKSTDRGRHWSAISPDLTRNEREHQQISGGPINPDVSGAEFYNTLTEIAPSTLQAGLIWTGNDDGMIHLTTDGGEHWKDVTPAGVPSYGFVGSIDPSHHEIGRAYLAIDRHTMGDRAPYAYVTEDYGATWKSIAPGLPADQPVRVLREDPRNADVLYAGVEEGIWVSLDRGASWHSLKMDMPTTSVRDIRVHPVANDLIVATHGRSLFILDELTPIQELRQAQAAGTYLYQPRHAYAFWQWTREDLQDNTAPANEYAGDNPDVGVMISFYLAKAAAKRPTIDIIDSSGRLVRRLEGTHVVDKTAKYYVTNTAGINRLTWNLTETGPVKRLSAPVSFQGSDDGPQVVPGTYTIALHVDGHTMSRTVQVSPDPRAPWTQADYEARHAFDAQLTHELTQIDTALNALDGIRKQVDERLKPLRSASSSPALVSQGDALLARLAALESAMTSNPHNDEDGTLFADKVRERIAAMQNTLSSSQQPPFASHVQQADEIHADVQRVLSDYETFMRTDVATFDAALRAAGQAPLKI
ncbi:MAG: hypothetical protein JO219_04225 [Candidatus Eremiobacteraeota bacterium]|nr:hypothetical protein [Candidatus Eremiobacteraeota bacterium]